jgi:UDP-N-acetylglucosamine diphosphorylase / glucose-1-phosphate thymidylyltransferase / UDP-N-acetylgalactosamine diphosphorylase / glucosamine-1-phosphate N-acetyltransferase / galactosamine-1-phosphate N-acetyltransferase
MVKMQEFVQRLLSSPLSSWCDRLPWSIVTNAEEIVREMVLASREMFELRGTIAVHPTATVETGAVVKGPAVIGAECFIACGAYLRGGVWLDERCSIGPGSELKSSFIFSGSKLAHLNFVADSILGSDVNLEAGSIIANHRNERIDKQIRVRIGTRLHSTGAEKFGALVGDRVKIGANSVLAPGTLIRPDQVIPRLSLVDQESD